MRTTERLLQLLARDVPRKQVAVRRSFVDEGQHSHGIRPSALHAFPRSEAEFECALLKIAGQVVA